MCVVLGILIRMSAWSTRRHLGAPISYWEALQHRWRPRILGTATTVGVGFVLFGALCCAAGLSFLGGVLLGSGVVSAAIAVAMVTGGIKPTLYETPESSALIANPAQASSSVVAGVVDARGIGTGHNVLPPKQRGPRRPAPWVVTAWVFRQRRLVGALGILFGLNLWSAGQASGNRPGSTLLAGLGVLLSLAWCCWLLTMERRARR
jgi:hypothetical protein